MKDLLYYYAIVYIIRLMYSTIKHFSNKYNPTQEEVVKILASSDLNKNLKQMISLDMLWSVINVIWMIMGIFYCEPIPFIILLFVFNVFLPFFIFMSKKADSNVILVIGIIAQMLISFSIFYGHFFK